MYIFHCFTPKNLKYCHFILASSSPGFNQDSMKVKQQSVCYLKKHERQQGESCCLSSDLFKELFRLLYRLEWKVIIRDVNLAISGKWVFIHSCIAPIRVLVLVLVLVLTLILIAASKRAALSFSRCAIRIIV